MIGHHLSIQFPLEIEINFVSFMNPFFQLTKNHHYNRPAEIFQTLRLHFN